MTLHNVHRTWDARVYTQKMKSLQCHSVAFAVLFRRDEEQTFANYDSIIFFFILWMDHSREFKVLLQCATHAHEEFLRRKVLICETRSIAWQKRSERTSNLTEAHRTRRKKCLFSHEHVDFFAYFHIYYSYILFLWTFFFVR